MKIIKQHDERDCGAACLSMIAMHYGLKYPISKYREITKTDKNGVNLYGMVNGAEKIGLKAEALSGSPDELSEGIQSGEIKLPFIAHTVNEDGMQHFIVVYKLKNNKFVCADPGKGKVKYTYDEFFSLWGGYIVTFEKTEKFAKGNYTKGGFKKFFSLLKGQGGILVTTVILSIIISFIGIIGAFVFQIVIDDFYTVHESEVCEDGCTEDHEHTTEIPPEENENFIDIIINFISDNKSNFNLFFIMLIGLYILQGIIQFFRGYLISVLSKNIDVRLMLPYYDHIIDLPMGAVSTRNTGEYISRFSDASTIRSAVSGATLTLFLDSLMVLGCGVILFIENKILFLISLITVISYLIVILCYRKVIEKSNRDVMENNARVQSYLKESIDGIETVKSHSAENTVKEKNNSKFIRLIKAVFKNNIISISQDSICDAIELIGTVVILWLGFGMVLENVVTVGSLMTFYALLAYFTEPVKNLIELQPMMQTAIVAAERLNDILDIETENQTDGVFKSLKWENIEFSHVDFRYGNRELTLEDISLNIKKGDRIAIVGESGSGKTTLAKLLMKFYTPESGSIKVDGVDISKLSVDSVRCDISYVDQNTFLFSDSVKNNILIGCPNATDGEIDTACRLSSIHELIQKLPQGYDTYLDENGKNLSGGQRQRLAIARALLKKPKLLILDEATSNLDTVTEGAIKNTIFNLGKELTCIIIAHRLSTIKNCDKIVVMDDGKILELGTHDELIALGGRYFEMFKNGSV